MTIGKRASRTGIAILLLFVAATVAIAQTRARNDQTDRDIRTSSVRAAVQAPIRNQAAVVSTLAVQPAHAASRISRPSAPVARSVNEAAMPAPQFSADLANELQSDPKVYAASEKAYYATANEIAYYRTGLKFTIIDITIPTDRRPVVTFKMTDDAGQPLDRLGVLTPGAVSSSFILAYLPKSTTLVTDYVAYTTRVAGPSPITGKTAIQAGADSGGAYTPSGQLDGIYTYRFGTALPSNYDGSLTHTLGMYGRRDLREFGFSFYAANPTKDWIPNSPSVAPTQIHQVVLTANCNQCHDPLALHGETGRREVQICILCHTQQSTDPDTGNTVDMKVMIHKIHSGNKLPSVVAGTPYIIIGNAMSVHDYSDITYPQDIRNCQTCHKAAAQVNAWLLQPTIEACGSCHDDVNFATGKNHVAGPYADNSQCATCHQPSGKFEYDASVAGAHTVPYKSNQLQYPKLTIQSITNTAPGQNPTVTFQIKDKNGVSMDPAKFGGSLGRFSANLAGPTTDYTTRITESIVGATWTNGVGTYTFKTIKIPTTATDTWAMEFEGRLTATIIKGGNAADTITQRDAMDNVVKFFAVTGTTVTPRRTAVALTLCNKCHEKLQLHGSNRNQIEACVVCHNPTLVAGAGAAATPVSFQVMVHRIHTGAELTNSYVIGGTDFKEVTYPGNRKNCAACHTGTSYQMPLPSTNVAVATPNWYWTPTQPMAAACLACHDSVSTAAHAFIMTTTFGGSTVTAESCPVCHKEATSLDSSIPFAVTRVHAR